MKEEKKAAEETDKDNFNLLLQYGLVDNLTPEELAKYSTSLGLSESALKSMGAKKEPPELKEVNGSLYQITYDPKTGEPSIEVLIQGKTGGSGGSGSSKTVPQFGTQAYDNIVKNLAEGNISVEELGTSIADGGQGLGAGEISAIVDRYNEVSGAGYFDSASDDSAQSDTTGSSATTNRVDTPIDYNNIKSISSLDSSGSLYSPQTAKTEKPKKSMFGTVGYY